MEMNTIRFIQPCSRDCSVQLTAHGAAGGKKLSPFKSRGEKVGQAVK